MSKELAVKEENAVALPSYMSKFKNEGKGDVTADMIEKSFLSMAHETKENVEFGEFYDSATGLNLGKEVKITVCSILPQVWRKFNDAFKLEATSNDGRVWDNGEPLTEEEKWKNAFIDMFVYLNDQASDLPMILSFKGTSFRTGKKLATTIAKFMSSGDEPIFARNYTLHSEEEKKGTKSYCVSRYKINSGFNDELVAKKASEIRKMVATIKVSINEVDPKENLNENEVD